MGIDAFFRKGLRINPTVGVFVVGGGLVLAVAAMAVSWFKDRWFADRQSIMIAIGGLLGVSLLAAILAVLAPTDRSEAKFQRIVFSWSSMLLLVGYPWALFLSIVTSGWPQPFVCLTQPWQRCPNVLAELAKSAAPPSAQPPDQTRPIDGAPPKSLSALEGRWTLGAPSQCDGNSFDWFVYGDIFLFRNSKGQVDEEKVMEINNDSLLTRNVRSSHGDKDSIWIYHFNTNGRVSSQDLSGNQKFTLTRCQKS